MIDEVAVQELVNDIAAEFRVKFHWHKPLRMDHPAEARRRASPANLDGFFEA